MSRDGLFCVWLDIMSWCEWNVQKFDTKIVLFENTTYVQLLWTQGPVKILQKFVKKLWNFFLFHGESTQAFKDPSGYDPVWKACNITGFTLSSQLLTVLTIDVSI